MSNCNQPLTLRDACLRKVRETLNDVLEKWFRMLRLAGTRSIYSYSQQVDEVTNECKKLSELLTSLPTHILDDLIPPLVTNFVTNMSFHHTIFLDLKNIREHAEKKHEAVCLEMLKSVLGPFTRRYNTGLLFSFGQKLIIQTFNSTPNLNNLVFGTVPTIDNSALLANNIHHLKHLESFQYNYMCTDQVVQQLALHCSKLRKLDVSYSPAVTDGSVQHLLKLKDLRDLGIKGTSVTNRSYELLNSRLPNIKNINYL
jgi:hypothetical protein